MRNNFQLLPNEVFLKTTFGWEGLSKAVLLNLGLVVNLGVFLTQQALEKSKNIT